MQDNFIDNIELSRNLLDHGFSLSAREVLRPGVLAKDIDSLLEFADLCLDYGTVKERQQSLIDAYHLGSPTAAWLIRNELKLSDDDKDRLLTIAADLNHPNAVFLKSSGMADLERAARLGSHDAILELIEESNEDEWDEIDEYVKLLIEHGYLDSAFDFVTRAISYPSGVVYGLNQLYTLVEKEYLPAVEFAMEIAALCDDLPRAQMLAIQACKLPNFKEKGVIGKFRMATFFEDQIYRVNASEEYINIVKQAAYLGHFPAIEMLTNYFREFGPQESFNEWSAKLKSYDFIESADLCRDIWFINDLVQNDHLWLKLVHCEALISEESIRYRVLASLENLRLSDLDSSRAFLRDAINVSRDATVQIVKDQRKNYSPALIEKLLSFIHD